MADGDKNEKETKKTSFLQKIENGNTVETSNKLFEELIGKKYTLKPISNIFKDETVSQIKKNIYLHKSV